MTKLKQNAIQRSSTLQKVFNFAMQNFHSFHIYRKCLWKQEQRGDSYELVKRRSDVTNFKQAQNKESNHVFGKYIISRCDHPSKWNFESVYCRVSELEVK